MERKNQYYVVRDKALPEVLQKVVEVKALIEANGSMTIQEAVSGPVEWIPFLEAAGRVSAEFVYLYPPGIPILVPGERITGKIVERVREYQEKGLSVQGLSDSSLTSILAVAKAAPV